MKVAIIMGSDSDFPIVKPAISILKEFNIDYKVFVASAHRTPHKVKEIVTFAEDNGVKIFISAAGAAAHLGGVIASYTTLPVISIPIDATSLKGMDALLSTVQMPPGIPVATMGINGAKNAAIFAIEILSIGDNDIKNQLVEYRKKMEMEVLKKNERLQKLLEEI